MALHCPATLLVAPVPADAREVDALADSVTEERILGVVGAPGSEAARRLAEVLDVPLEDEPGLAADQPEASVWVAIADMHRGETVVVLSPSAGAGGTPFVRREAE